MGWRVLYMGAQLVAFRQPTGVWPWQQPKKLPSQLYGLLVTLNSIVKHGSPWRD